MVALFFVPVVVVVVVVVVVAIAERKRESVCVRKRNKCGEY
jgi:cytochrome c-type biogenesis protein CcmH/NrfF